MKNIRLANTILNFDTKDVTGEVVTIDNEKYYKIANYDRMPDFFMAVVSDSDLWMYISSNGSLTAGRKDRNNALFPYYTEDKIHDYRGKTGSTTSCLVDRDGHLFLWEPFAAHQESIYRLERNLYKSIYGNSIIFEEKNPDLEMTFRYGWHSSEKYGWIKRSQVESSGSRKVKIRILDGIRNILPYGVDYAFQNEYSNLLTAYRKNELLPESGIALFLLSSIPSDTAEPSEALRATVVWPAGTCTGSQFLISDRQREAFRRGERTETETDLFGSAGAYYTVTEYEIRPQAAMTWYFVADVNKDSSDVVNLDRFLRSTGNAAEILEAEITRGTVSLVRLVGAADGLQLSGDHLGDARHFSNTLFNIMRGGIFENNYDVSAGDFVHFVSQCNRGIHERHKVMLRGLPGILTRDALAGLLGKEGDPDLDRICLEYLPLTFSRRHGDPSRPWNRFQIEPKLPDGSRKTGYQGNWRDIFQNWEALCLSFPGYTESVIARFVNASTADGYNPYRISREGIDWERPAHDDPWAYIGYWGDHQLIYLQKFLEQSCSHNPGSLDRLLDEDIFVYASVPYRIRPVEQMIVNPKDTIVFDWNLDSQIGAEVGRIGSDGALLRRADGEIHRVNLMEKILCSLLAKIVNFVPGAGIWLNTQRPEWNDANNALVGNGTSVVTLCYLRRSLRFWINLLENSIAKEFNISGELAALLEKVSLLLSLNRQKLSEGFSESDRYDFAFRLGKVGSDYRQTIYESSFSGSKMKVSSVALCEFMKLMVKYADRSIDENRREDGLFHSYNLISFRDKRIAVRRLYLMLEGQVAVLSSGYPDPAMSLKVLDAMRSSTLYRPDQQSYMLYPFRQLPRFTDKNNIPPESVNRSLLLQKMIERKDSSIVTVDSEGGVHFNGSFRNEGLLSAAIDAVDADTYGKLPGEEKDLILSIYESVFDHQSFTGRSGTFYGYEGLGSIYWHMVSKLLLAIRETYAAAEAEVKAKPAAEPGAGAEAVDGDLLEKIREHYHSVKEGLGVHKSPALHGAFPVDAYSHTPAGAGAKQPGLTGQVKEDFISRLGELGVIIRDGMISFVPSMLRKEELLGVKEYFTFFDTGGNEKTIELEPGQLAFTLCQVPVIYSTGIPETVTVIFADGERKVIRGCIIDKLTSRMIFERSGKITEIRFATNHIRKSL